MKTNLLAAAVALSDQDLLARLHSLARTERESTAEVIAHLTALEIRPSLYLADGYGSLFDYCTRALGLSEDAACTRTNVVRVCGRLPVILDHLFAGALTLTAVRLLAPHLTAENHEAVLARASNKRKEDIEALVAELAPRPDVPSTVRKLPGHTDPAPRASRLSDPPPGPADGSTPATPTALPDVSPATALDHDDAGETGVVLQPPSAHLPRHRPIVQALAPQRYRVQFTIGQEAHDDLRTVQALLRREIPNGDAGTIFERALTLLRKEVERTKLGKAAKPGSAGGGRRPRRAYEYRIRSGTDDHKEEGASHGVSQERERRTATQRFEVGPALMWQERAPSRHIPNAVKRAVWYRDGGQCAFVSVAGRRCAERNFLELHHIQPYALEGPATAGNIALRCRRHNQHEADLVFGPRITSGVGEVEDREAGGQEQSVLTTHPEVRADPGPK